MAGANISALCREFGISRKTGYKWLERYGQGGEEALVDRSRCPYSSPSRTSVEVEEAILAVREAHPAWGGRKILAYLERQGRTDLPSPSTVTAIMCGNGRIDPDEAEKHQPFHRFEMAAPNELWQIDFKGHFPLKEGACHTLTVLDDHSRFLLGLKACRDQARETVQVHLTNIFRQYGVPQCILVDNGPPWGDGGQDSYTVLEAWFFQLGMEVSHSRPYHPQTLGKDERLHRTLKAEVISRYGMLELEECQRYFDEWREVYNRERPHEALGMAVPCERYQPSSRPFPEVLPPILYDPQDEVRMVDETGKISFRGETFRVGKAFYGYPVALRPAEDGSFAVFFCHKRIATIHLQRYNR